VLIFGIVALVFLVVCVVAFFSRRRRY